MKKIMILTATLGLLSSSLTKTGPYKKFNTEREEKEAELDRYKRDLGYTKEKLRDKQNELKFYEDNHLNTPIGQIKKEIEELESKISKLEAEIPQLEAQLK